MPGYILDQQHELVAYIHVIGLYGLYATVTIILWLLWHKKVKSHHFDSKEIIIPLIVFFCIKRIKILNYCNKHTKSV